MSGSSTGSTVFGSALHLSHVLHWTHTRSSSRGVADNSWLLLAGELQLFDRVDLFARLLVETCFSSSLSPSSSSGPWEASLPCALLLFRSLMLFDCPWLRILFVDCEFLTHKSGDGLELVSVHYIPRKNRQLLVELTFEEVFVRSKSEKRAGKLLSFCDALMTPDPRPVNWVLILIKVLTGTVTASETFSKRNPSAEWKRTRIQTRLLLQGCFQGFFLVTSKSIQFHRAIWSRYLYKVCSVYLHLINNPSELFSISESNDWKTSFFHYNNMAPKVGAHVVVYTLMFGGTTLAAIAFSKTFSKSQGELDAELRAKYPELIKRSQDQKVHMQAFFDKVLQVSNLLWLNLYNTCQT